MAGEPWTNAEVAASEEALSTWQVSPQRMAAGKCPRCEGDASQTLAFGGVVIASANEDGGAVDAPALFRCNCDEQHSGRPKGMASGCGAWWVAHVSAGGGNTLHVRPESDSSIRAATQTVSDALDESGSATKTAAEKWVPGIAALLSLSGLATVIVSRDTVSAFDHGLRLVLFGMVCVAIVTAALATINAYRAAFGWPTNVSLATTADVLAAARKVKERAATSAGKLRIAVTFAVVSTATLLGALGILWVAPAGPSKPTANLEYTAEAPSGTNSARCVEILSVSTGTLQAKVITGGPTDTISVPLSRITKLESATCKGK